MFLYKRCLIFCILFLLVIYRASAQENVEVVEATYLDVRNEIFSLADRVDSYFGDIRTIQDRNSDYLRVGEEIRFRAASPMRFRQKASLSVNLDAVSKQLRLIAEGEDGEQRKNGERLDDLQQGDDYLNDFNKVGSTIGLRYDFLRNEKTDVALTTGLRFSGGPDPFSKIKFTRHLSLDENWFIEPSEQFLWYFHDGFGERTRFDLIRTLTQKAFFRSRTEALWSETSQGVNMSQEFSVLEELSKRSVRGVSFSMVAFTAPGAVDEFRAALRYRRNFLFPWLYGEVQPAIVFPDERSYRTTPEITIKVEVYFDRLGASRFEMVP